MILLDGLSTSKIWKWVWRLCVQHAVYWRLFLIGSLCFLSIWLPDEQPAYPKLLGPSKLWISSSCSEICRKRTQKMSSKEGVKDQLCSLITTRSRGEKRKQRKRKRRGRLKKRGWGGEGGERERNRQVKRRYKN